MIEIKGFWETSFLDWPGKICSVLFLACCNFRCPCCHNYSLVLNPDQYVSIPFQEVLSRLLSFREWIDGVCVTGGEPTLDPDLPVFIQKIKQHGFLIKLDTNGSNPDMLEKLIERKEIDYVSMDVKGLLNPFSYRSAAGVSVDLERIRMSIDTLKSGAVEYQFRVTVVPGLHRPEDILLLGDQLRAGERVILQNFNPEDPLDSSLKGIRPFDRRVVKDLEKQIQSMI